MTIIFAVIAFSIIPCFAASKIDLTGGYYTDVVEEVSKSTFESISHFKYLFFKSQKVCRVDQCSVSPDNKYIIYQGDSENNIFIIEVATQRRKQLTKDSPGSVREFDWKKKPGSIIVDIYDKCLLTIMIPTFPANSQPKQ